MMLIFNWFWQPWPTQNCYKLLDILEEARVHPLEQQESFKDISNHNNIDERMISCKAFP